MNLELYSDKLICKSCGYITPRKVEIESAAGLRKLNRPVLNAFLDDDAVRDIVIPFSNTSSYYHYYKVCRENEHQIEDEVSRMSIEWDCKQNG